MGHEPDRLQVQKQNSKHLRIRLTVTDRDPGSCNFRITPRAGFETCWGYLEGFDFENVRALSLRELVCKLDFSISGIS
jgi:hypothetical protein